MKSYKEFCDRYEYDVKENASKKLYEKYKTNLAIFQSIMTKKIERGGSGESERGCSNLH